MDSYFFHPPQIEISENLVLLPFLPDRKYLKMLEKDSIRQKRVLGSMLYSYSRYDVILGFLGYPNLLTVLEFISEIRKKRMFFLGTAGSLDSAGGIPELVNINRIFPGEIFSHFSASESFRLTESSDESIRKVSGVSIDIIQREDLKWYSNIKKRDIGIVEMEIYPLRWYMGREFTAYVVLSDQVTKSGIKTFKKDLIMEEFIKGIEIIKKEIKCGTK